MRSSYAGGSGGAMGSPSILPRLSIRSHGLMRLQMCRMNLGATTAIWFVTRAIDKIVKLLVTRIHGAVNFSPWCADCWDFDEMHAFNGGFVEHTVCTF